MRIHEYLEAVRNCPDDLLRGEYGIHDNLVLLLNQEYDMLTAAFAASTGNEHLFRERYHEITPGSIPIIEESAPELASKLQNMIVERRNGRRDFACEQGTVLVKVVPGVRFYSGRRAGKHAQRQFREFKTTISLHPYLRPRWEGRCSHRALAEVLEDICQYAARTGTAVCVPEPFEWRKNGNKRYEHLIVYSEKSAE